jgi:hypothetical protein
MTVRIPFITNIGDGVSIGFDGHQFGLAFLDTCTLISCQSTINVDSKMQRLLGSSSQLTIEYNYTEGTTKILAFKLAGIKPSLALLQQLAVDPAPAIASTLDDKTRTASILRYTLERRELPSADSINTTTAIWKTPYKKCTGVPETIEVTLSKELQIIDDRRLDEWLDRSRRCTDAAFVWVRSENRKGESFDPSDLAISTVLEIARKKFPAAEVPVDDKDLVPTSQWVSNAWAAVRPKTPKSETVNSAMAMSNDHDWRTSKLVGLDIYNEANESLGLINDLIIDRSGKFLYVIIKVGGFLGGPEKLVAVAFDKLKWVNEPLAYAGAGGASAVGASTGSRVVTTTTGSSSVTDTATPRRNNPWYPDHAIYKATKDELKAMPEFKY